MPFTFSLDRDNARVSAVANGSITYGDIVRHLEDERRRGGLPYAELIDARGARPDFTSEDVRQIVDWLRSAASRGALGPTAVVVDSDVAYGMLRMLETLLDDAVQLRPFRSMDAAQAWLAGAGRT
jgi:hypothetical protein